MQYRRLPSLFLAVSVSVGLLGGAVAHGQTLSSQARSLDAERERAYNRMMYQKNFKELQLASQRLLRGLDEAHLTSEDLSKETKSIHRSAKILRTLMGVPGLARSVDTQRDLSSPQAYESAIRQLHKLVWEFAHNPVHQNSKVFNANMAQQAQTDLLTIINLSKEISNRARGFAPVPQNTTRNTNQ